MQKIEEIISGRGNCICKGPGVGHASRADRRPVWLERREGFRDGEVRWDGNDGQGQGMHSVAGQAGCSVFILSNGSQCRVTSRNRLNSRL